jgi:hypothetical protein
LDVHFTPAVRPGLHFERIDQAQINNVDRNFRVVATLELIPGRLFEISIGRSFRNRGGGLADDIGILTG